MFIFKSRKTVTELVLNMLQATYREGQKINWDNEVISLPRGPSAGTKCYENDKSIATINWLKNWTN